MCRQIYARAARLRLAIVDELGHIAQNRKTADAKQVDLDQAKLLDGAQVKLGDGDALAARAHDRNQIG